MRHTYAVIRSAGPPTSTSRGGRAYGPSGRSAQRTNVPAVSPGSPVGKGAPMRWEVECSRNHRPSSSKTSGTSMATNPAGTSRGGPTSQRRRSRERRVATVARSAAGPWGNRAVRYMIQPSPSRRTQGSRQATLPMGQVAWSCSYQRASGTATGFWGWRCQRRRSVDVATPTRST